MEVERPIDHHVVLELGRGGMGRALLAIAKGPAGFRKLEVIKRLHAELAGDPHLLEMFLAEARLAARFNHPNIVQTYGIGFDALGHYLEMEYLEGASYDELTREASAQGGLPLPISAFILGQVLEGLRYAHELVGLDGAPLQLVHRDVSPHNVFVTHRGGVKLLDFGIAKLVETVVVVGAAGGESTRAGAVKGKARYMAPEQAMGAAVDHRADLFAVGVMLWQAITGVRLWGELSDEEVLSRLRAGAIPDVERACEHPPPQLVAICRRALAPRRDDRFSSAEQMQRGLEAYLDRIEPRVSARTVEQEMTARFDARRRKVQATTESAFRELERVEQRARQEATATHAAAFRPPAPARVVVGSLSPPTRFFGRSAELGDLERSFAEGVRLVTLLGPGGIGKTRLACRFLERRLADAHDCADHETRVSAHDVFCELGAAIDLSTALEAVARGCSIPLLGPSIDDTVVDALRARGPACVVLDNCEHAAAAVALLVSRWLREAPQIVFLATSRDRLDIAGEHVHELLPLDLEGAAIELFVDRATAAGASVDDRAAIAALVRRLDGIPLAIELAAARTRVMTPAEILSRLDARFEILGGGPRDAAARQRTLHATIEASFEPLVAVERSAFAQCSVFAGGFDLRAAEAVVELKGGTARGDEPPHVVDVLQALHDRSLLRTESVHGAMRFGFYETIAAYARERLAELGAAAHDEVESRHAAHFALVAPEWSEGFARDGDVEALAKLARESQNLVAAHAFALGRAIDGDAAHGDFALALMNALSSLFIARGPIDVYRAMLDRTLDPRVVERADPRGVARVALRRGYLHAVVGHFDEARADVHAAIERSRDLAGAPGGVVLEASSFRMLGIVERMAGRETAARDALERAIALSRASSDASLLALAVLNLAQLDHVVGRLEAARGGLREVRRLESTLGTHSTFGLLEHTLGCVLQELGAFDEARVEHEAAVEVARSRDHRHYLAAFLLGLAQLDHEVCSPLAAAARYEEAAEVSRALGEHPTTALSLGGLGALHAREGRLSEARRRLDEAEDLAAPLGEPALNRTLSLLRVHLGLAEGTTSKTEAAAAIEASTMTERSDEVRFARRLLGAALPRY